MRKSRLMTLIGILLGTGAPLGAILLRIPLSHLPVEVFLREEWEAHSFFYVYMLLGTSLVLGFFGFFAGRDEDRVLQRNVLLKDQALTDPLTGLGNHRFLHDVFKIEFRRHITSRRPLTCLMMDLDHFKRINDRFGHPFGDKVLRHFATIIRHSIREGDVAARYGGEEFLCILPDCDRVQARRVAERIRGATASYRFHYKKRKVQVTVSVGVVTSYESGGLNYRHLIGLADRALYDAKHQGRNQVVQTTLKPSGT